MCINDFLRQQQEQEQQQHSAMKQPHEASQTEKSNIEVVPVSILGTTPIIAQQNNNIQSVQECPWVNFWNNAKNNSTTQ